MSVNSVNRIVLTCPCCQVSKLDAAQYPYDIFLTAPAAIFNFADTVYSESLLKLIATTPITEITFIGNSDCMMIQHTLNKEVEQYEFKFQHKIRAIQKLNDSPLKLIKRICENGFKELKNHPELSAKIEQKRIELSIELVSTKNFQSLINYHPNLSIQNSIL